MSAAIAGPAAQATRTKPASRIFFMTLPSLLQPYSPNNCLLVSYGRPKDLTTPIWDKLGGVVKIHSRCGTSDTAGLPTRSIRLENPAIATLGLIPSIDMEPIQMRGADILLKALKLAGVRKIFALSGNHIMS